MKQLFLLLGAILFLSKAQSQNCNCPANEFGYPTAKKADTVFHLSNGRSIALCGYKDTIKGRAFYSEFVLAACGEGHVIKFWGAVLNCKLHVHKDTLIIETVDSLPTGKNMQYKWTVWAIEQVYFKNGKAVKDFRINRQILKYDAQEIQSALKLYEQGIKKDADSHDLNRVNDVNMETADKLFMSAISGSQQARSYLMTFRKHFGGLSGAYLEWWVDDMRKLKLWDTNVEADEDFLHN
ncbi:MAG: hypothetical protein ACHQHN_18070 [Sphingobacteriales bacterium]